MTTDKKYWKLFYKKETGEAVIHFDYRAIKLGEDDFAPIGVNIYHDSGGKIALITDYANCGILKLQENLAMDIGLNDHSMYDAVETVVNEIERVMPHKIIIR